MCLALWNHSISKVTHKSVSLIPYTYTVSYGLQQTSHRLFVASSLKMLKGKRDTIVFFKNSFLLYLFHYHLAPCIPLLYFFHYNLSPLYPLPPPPPTSAITTLPSLSMSFFSVCFLLCPSNPYICPTPRAVSLLSIYESISVLLVCSISSLDFTCEWNHMVLSISDWLISLSIMFSRSIHAVKKGKGFFFFTAE